MNIELLLFYLFSSLALLSAALVVGATNPIHSVLFLILVFCNATGLLLILELEFLAMVFLVVYVGAIAVLFLFVVMMLNINIVEYNENVLRYLPMGGLIGIIFLLEVFLVVDSDLVPLLRKPSVSDPESQSEIAATISSAFDSLEVISWVKKADAFTNVEAIGQVIYTTYFAFFILAGIILLISMIGAIVLTCSVHAMQRGATQVRRQQIFEQVARDFNKTIVLRTFGEPKYYGYNPKPWN